MSHVVQMWRNWIDTASEITVMWEVDFIALFETLCDSKSKKPITPLRMRFLIMLVLFEEFELFFEWSFFDDFWGDSPLVVPFGNIAETSTNRPDVLHRFEDFAIQIPLDTTENVKNLAHRLHVSATQILDSLHELRFDLCHLGLSQVIPSEVEVLPRCRRINHG